MTWRAPGGRMELLRTPTFDEQLARTEFAVGWHLHRTGQTEAAARHFERAGELAPFDFCVRRGSMPIRDMDPMGPDFFEMFQQWQDAGRPYYDD